MSSSALDAKEVFAGELYDVQIACPYIIIISVCTRPFSHSSRFSCMLVMSVTVKDQRVWRMACTFLTHAVAKGIDRTLYSTEAAAYRFPIILDYYLHCSFLLPEAQQGLVCKVLDVVSSQCCSLGDGTCQLKDVHCEAESGLIYTSFLAGSCHFSTSKHSAVHYLVGLALALNKHSK